MTIDDPTIQWLLAADPAVAWQTRRDLLDAPEPEFARDRARVETDGWGAALLARAGADGLFDGGACFPGVFSRELFEAEEGQPWTATLPTLAELRRLGLPPDCPSIRRLLPLIDANARWEYDDLPFFAGEVEPCINGQTVALGAYFGRDMAPLVERLLGEVMADGGWNCEQENGSTRSSFHTTICVVEGLAEFERSSADAGLVARARAARLGAEEYLLERGLFRRASTGEVADPDFLALRNPDRWYYSTLRALDHLRAAHPGETPDGRVAGALERLRARQRPDGRFPLEIRAPGRVWFHPDEVGEPSPMVTLKALRVLRWADGQNAQR